jgi:hypothetical protein
MTADRNASPVCRRPRADGHLVTSDSYRASAKPQSTTTSPSLVAVRTFGRFFIAGEDPAAR